MFHARPKLRRASACEASAVSRRLRPGLPERCAKLGVSETSAQPAAVPIPARRAHRAGRACSLLGRRGRTWRCPHSAKGDMRALNEGQGLTPTGHPKHSLDLPIGLSHRPRD
jgi:hypothetical protein